MNKKNKIIIAALILVFFFGIILALFRNSKVRNVYAIISKDGHYYQNTVNYLNQRKKRKQIEKKIQKQTDELAKKRRIERKELNGDANAQVYLNTPTYDLSGQGNHPDVLYFKDKFNGYKYWMVFTPYAESQSSLENPSILTSDDGIKWRVPHGLKNPIAGPPDDVNDGGHYSDPDMIYADKKLVVFFVYNKVGIHGGSKFYRIESSDGIHWSPRKLVFETRKREDGYSPSFVYSNSMYKMWYFGGENKFLYRTSKDCVNWSEPVPVNINVSGWRSWHIKVKETDLGYEALICYRKDNTNTRALFYAQSNNGTDWKVDHTPVIYPSAGKWDTGGIYRSTFTKDDGFYKVWYSAYNLNDKWHIGYSQGKSIDMLKGMK